MTGNNKHFEYGFRYDPTQWIQTDTSTFAAMVRTQILSQPQDGDKAILDAVINKILDKEQPNGSLGMDSKETGSMLLDLLELGVNHDNPQVKKAAEVTVCQIQTNPNSNEGKGWDKHVLSIYAIHALWRLGKRDLPEVTYSLKWLLDNQDKWNDPWVGCPWTPEVFFSGLWTAREFPGTKEAVKKGLQRVLNQMNDVGCCAYNDPWGLIDAASRIDLPEAREIIKREVPMILRNQRPGGGWRHRSPETFRALIRHGLFDLLLNLPPLPPDWQIVKEVSLPEGKWASLTWDGKYFWSLEQESKIAFAFSASDGQVIRQVPIPHAESIAWWNGAFVVVGNEPKVLRKIDPETGTELLSISLNEIGDVCDCEIYRDKVIVGDGFECNIAIIDPQTGRKRDEQVLAGPGPGSIAVQDDTLWHVDFWAHSIIRTGLGGRLLDWGEKPIWDVTGLAFDGKHLCVLDGKTDRICTIEKTHY